MSDLTHVEIEQRDDVVAARLTGELDISVAESAGKKIADAVPSSAGVFGSGSSPSSA